MIAGRSGSPELESFTGQVLSGSEEARRRWNRLTIRTAGVIALAGAFVAPGVMELAVAAGAVDMAGDMGLDNVERSSRGRKK